MPIREIGKYIFANDKNIKAIRFPDSMVETDRLIAGNNPHIEIIVSGKNMEKIGEGAFLNCSNLHTVILNDGLQEIEGQVFAGCPSLKEVEIPASVEKMYSSTFLLHSDDFTIIGEAGSYAEQYAKEQNINFRAK